MKSITKLFYALALSVLMFSYSCTDYAGGGDYGNNPPDILLTYPELVTMLNHYDETRKAQFGAVVGKPEDTRITFFTIKELKDYIAYVEKEAKKKKIPLTGINFISAAYPDNYQRDPIKSNFRTLIMFPATTINGEKMVSFDPFRSEKRDPKPLKEILNDEYGYTVWTYDTLAGRSSTKKRAVRSRTSKSSGGFSAGGNRAGISPPM